MYHGRRFCTTCKIFFQATRCYLTFLFAVVVLSHLRPTLPGQTVALRGFAVVLRAGWRLGSRRAYKDGAAPPTVGTGGAIFQNGKRNMITANDIMRDADVAELAGMKVETFQRKMKRGTFGPGELDWRAADPVSNGRERLWFRRDVERVWRERIRVGSAEASRQG